MWTNKGGGGVLHLFSDALGLLPIRRRGIQIAGWPRSLEIRENRENGENKLPAGKNQGISKFIKNQGIIREFYNSEEKKCVYW